MRKQTSTRSPKEPMSKIVKLSNYRFKVQRVGGDLYRFIPLNFDHLPTVHPFVAVGNDYWLLQCKPEELDAYIVKLSKKLNPMNLESMDHFYARLAEHSASPLQGEPVKSYHKPSAFVLNEAKRQEAIDSLTKGKFHHHPYRHGTFWDFLAGVWWGDHFNK